MFFWLRYGIQGLSTLANDAPGAIRYSEYVDSSGVNTHEPQIQVRLYNATGGACVVGRPYMVTYDGDEETNPSVTTPAAVSAPCWVVFATEATATASWGWFTIAGYDDVLVEGTTDVAKDDFLKITAATTATAMLKDGTTKTTDSIAIACAAQASNSEVLTKCYIIGEAPIDID